MLDVLKFILKCVIDFMAMLFTIDLGFTNLGALMCIVYIFLPTMLFVVNFLRKQFIDELDDYYDDKRYPVRQERRKQFKESRNKK